MNVTTLNPLINSTTTDGTSEDLSNTTVTSTTVTPYPHKFDEKNRSFLYILVPLVTIGIIALLTAMILLFLRKKRLDRLRHRLMPFYNFEPGEEEDWETELLDDESDISNKKGYRSMDHSSSNSNGSHPRLE